MQSSQILLELAHFGFIFILASDYDVLEFLLAGTGRNQMSADDILFQALEVVDARPDGSFAKYLRGLLEGGGGNE